MVDVSVIITCYNLEHFLTECVESIKAQTAVPDEIIIVHDGCKEAGAYDGCTTVFRQKNAGVARSRHEGFLLSNRQFILFVDADDVIPETYIETGLRAMKPDIDIVYPDSLLWSHWGEGQYQNKLYETPKVIKREKLWKQNYVLVSSLMRRQVYATIGGFDAELKMYEDWWFFLQAFQIGYRFKKGNMYLKYRQRMNSRNRQSDEEKNKWHKIIYDRAKTLGPEKSYDQNKRTALQSRGR